LRIAENANLLGNLVNRGNLPPTQTQALWHTNAIAVWGDPIIGRVLVLLLRSSGYEARFLFASSLWEVEALEDVGLLLLTPTPYMSNEHRETLLEALRNRIVPAKKPIGELTPLPSGETREEEGGMEDALWYMLPWPCRIEELVQRIEDIL
jgi:hypothetical protein